MARCIADCCAEPMEAPGPYCALHANPGLLHGDDTLYCAKYDCRYSRHPRSLGGYCWDHEVVAYNLRRTTGCLTNFPCLDMSCQFLAEKGGRFCWQHGPDIEAKVKLTVDAATGLFGIEPTTYKHWMTAFNPDGSPKTRLGKELRERYTEAMQADADRELAFRSALKREAADSVLAAKYIRPHEAYAAVKVGLAGMLRKMPDRAAWWGHPRLLAALNEYRESSSLELHEYLRRCHLLEEPRSEIQTDAWDEV